MCCRHPLSTHTCPDARDNLSVAYVIIVRAFSIDASDAEADMEIQICAIEGESKQNRSSNALIAITLNNFEIKT